MNDTPPEIRQKQIEMFLKKTPRERFLIGADLIDAGRIIMISNIKKDNPGISDLEVKIEVTKRCYSRDFQPAEMEKIIQSMINYYHKKSNSET